jgi:hypothetical protein
MMKIKVWNSYVDWLYKPLPQYIKFRQWGLTLFTSYYIALQELHRIKKIV